MRIKLEEEYMQNSKNHEDEVRLRLKFEGRFNTMQEEHRELEIRFDRRGKELRDTQKLVAKYEAEHRKASTELAIVQKVRVE